MIVNLIAVVNKGNNVVSAVAAHKVKLLNVLN